MKRTFMKTIQITQVHTSVGCTGINTLFVKGAEKVFDGGQTQNRTGDTRIFSPSALPTELSGQTKT